MGNIFNSKKLAVITSLGTLAFVSNGFLPSPIDKMIIGIQALSFSLASILVTKGGAIYASFVTGLLFSIIRTSFFPFSLMFSLFYGLLIDGFQRARHPHRKSWFIWNSFCHFFAFFSSSISLGHFKSYIAQLYSLMRQCLIPSSFQLQFSQAQCLILSVILLPSLVCVLFCSRIHC